MRAMGREVRRPLPMEVSDMATETKKRDEAQVRRRASTWSERFIMDELELGGWWPAFCIQLENEGNSWSREASIYGRAMPVRVVAR